MRRRSFIALLGGAAAWPLAAQTQHVMPVIGFLHSASNEANVEKIAAFAKGLGESGFVDGKNVTIEYHFAEGHYDRLPVMATELARQVTVLVIGGGNQAVRAAKAATAEIPIVFATGGDPVKAGLVDSLNRPGHNVTGVSVIFSALSAKRLGILHQLVRTEFR
jgi:putative ABC transport system substrate-binding protein